MCAHIHADARLLHPAARLRHTGLAGRTGRYHVGILVLFLYPDIRRTHLEVHHPCLRAAHHSGHRARLSWETAVGSILTALFVALQITSNHVQMSYYFFFVILFFVGAYFEKAWRTKTLPQFFKASAVLIVAALVA